MSKSKHDKVESGKETTFEELNVAGDADLETLKKALAGAKEDAEKYLSNWQRAEADFSNYKKRIDQERCDLVNSANAILILTLMPVLDDLERAFASLPPKLAELTWVDGVRLVHRKLQAILEAQGLVEIDAMGQPFDPCLHEAVAYQNGDEGIVIDEAQKGYKLKDKVLRPTLVMVGNGQDKAAEEETE